MKWDPETEERAGRQSKMSSRDRVYSLQDGRRGQGCGSVSFVAHTRLAWRGAWLYFVFLCFTNSTTKAFIPVCRVKTQERDCHLPANL